MIGHALQGCAEACKTVISRRLSLIRVAGRCTVLRFQWYQSGINTVLATISDKKCPRVSPTTVVAMSQGPWHRLGRDAGMWYLQLDCGPGGADHEHAPTLTKLDGLVVDVDPYHRVCPLLLGLRDHLR